MLSKTDLASYLNRSEDAERLVVRPMWMRNRIDKPAERLHLERGEMIKEVLKKTTNNRLPIHLGGLLFLFDGKKALDKYRWKSPDNKYIINLEDMTDGYPIEPGETVVAASSEYFEFPNNLGGIIISRVGNHLTGMDVGTTFIDAGWNGLITFQVRNVDHHTRLLKVGLEVARLFVFRLSSSVEEAAKHARNESHHGGRSWESVWQDGLSPFTGISVPERVEQVTSAPAADLATPEKDKPGRFSAIVDDWSGYFGFSKNFPIGIKVTALIFFGITLLNGFLASGLFGKLGQFTTLQSTVVALEQAVPVRRNARIEVPRNEKIGKVSIEFDKKRLDNNEVPMLVVTANESADKMKIKSVGGKIGGDKRNFEIVAELLEPSDNVVSYDVE